MPDRPAPGTAFPWTEAMQAGLGLLRLSPRAFWAATPRELAAALAPFGTVAGEAPARAALAALMQRFPDRDSSN
ncbi:MULTISPECIES: rcc01693 family protein [Aurantimonas]|uniref:rcc01693 family protein n=2 Tax=Aurantimonadaceae TaxID=255475 RepID=UPI00040ECE22|nr:rcc01693 family protein [Aurantimonas coralicida]